MRTFLIQYLIKRTQFVSIVGFLRIISTILKGHSILYELTLSLGVGGDGGLGDETPAKLQTTV